MCYYIQAPTICFVCWQTISYDVHQQSVCPEWYSPWHYPIILLQRRFDRCAECIASLPMEQRIQLSWIPQGDMIWVGEGLLIVRREPCAAVAEYMEHRDRLTRPAYAGGQDEAGLAPEEDTRGPLERQMNDLGTSYEGQGNDNRNPYEETVDIHLSLETETGPRREGEGAVSFRYSCDATVRYASQAPHHLQRT